MNLADALTTATAHGWSDDSAYTRQSIEQQASTERDGLVASIALYVGGVIRWNVFNPDNRKQSSTGTAASPEAAAQACNNAFSTLTGTLF